MDSIANTRRLARRSGRGLLYLGGRYASWASIMRFLALPFVFYIALPSLASENSASEFEAAREKWRSAGLKSYSFIYEWDGGVVIAPDKGFRISSFRVLK